MASSHLLVVFALVAAVAAVSISPVYSMPEPLLAALPPELVGDASDWTLYFQDEFDGPSLNTSLWHPKTGTHTNQEKEWYQPNRAFVQGGNLVLESVVEESHGLPYTSGWVDTQGSFATAQGMFVINAKLPFGDGMWPAHWLMPDADVCWPMGGEIDIMENLGMDMHRVHGALHYSHTACGDSGEKNMGGWSPQLPVNLQDDFHNYGIVWNETAIYYFVDDVYYTTAPNPAQEFKQQPFYIILNTALGGWGGPVHTSFPQYHYIDYVRVYKRA